MKKANFLMALIVFVFFTTQAQEFSLGIKGGLNMATLDVKDAGGSISNKTGFHGGAFALFKLSKIAIQPELIFSQQGTEFTFQGSDLEANFNYVNIPVLLKIYLIGGLNLQAGPQFGFLSSTGGKTIGEDGQVINNTKGLYKDSDVSVVLGVGWDLPFRLTVDARYNLGISEIEDQAAQSAIKNQVWQLSVGYKLFRFGK